MKTEQEISEHISDLSDEFDQLTDTNIKPKFGRKIRAIHSEMLTVQDHINNLGQSKVNVQPLHNQLARLAVKMLKAMDVTWPEFSIKIPERSKEGNNE